MTHRTQNGPSLATVRRFEAAGARAWPATSVFYDGAWAIRLTAGLPAKRLNSVNPLDPGDQGNLADRIERLGRRFESFGRPLTFRMSPLAGGQIDAHLDALGWRRFSQSLVMAVRLDEELLHDALHQIPMQDTGRFISAAISIGNLPPEHRPGLSEVIGTIQSQKGLFVHEQAGVPISTAICVRDGDLAGLFEVATDANQRRRGYGRRTLLSALKWAFTQGARRAWLQVEADNETAIGLYRSMGFSEIYRYHYRQPVTGESQ
ncbi:GNAT family N-acetyltransferase [Aerobium aerolatum]|uniref:Acetyltransferase (GNAT) family protein n=1 Tax=Aquamicrobium aerolatum DSM 21857 TaxID=1121003 RepID=A0A1I3RI44_9HYPH|nr:GNAT family N-acetyltransferase [Aquamicrobium aerolatum]SFJ45955.1 Acetyltransferase (GNAT) family protein [Aquamicrobium aerolatum DSM 21857]